MRAFRSFLTFTTAAWLMLWLSINTGPHVWERDAVEKAGLLHHQYPCLSTMTMDQEFEDTLMHRAGLMAKLAVEKGMKDAKQRAK